MFAEINSPDPVLSRLRELEERLNSLGGHPSEIEPIRATIASRELNRGNIYAEVLKNATSFVLEISKEIDAKVAARLNPIGDRAIAMLDAQTPEIELQQAERILADQEARVVPLAKQVAEVTRSAARVEERLARAGEALDQLWKAQDSSGIGGWRVVMRSVSAKVELAKAAEPSLLKQYRGAPTVDENTPAPAANIACPRCKKPSLRRVERATLLEEVLRVAFIAPYRCGSCGEHSYHFRYTVRTAG